MFAVRAEFFNPESFYSKKSLFPVHRKDFKRYHNIRGTGEFAFASLSSNSPVPLFDYRSIVLLCKRGLQHSPSFIWLDTAFISPPTIMTAPER